MYLSEQNGKVTVPKKKKETDQRIYLLTFRAVETFINKQVGL